MPCATTTPNENKIGFPQHRKEAHDRQNAWWNELPLTSLIPSTMRWQAKRLTSLCANSIQRLHYMLHLSEYSTSLQDSWNPQKLFERRRINYFNRYFNRTRKPRQNKTRSCKSADDTTSREKRDIVKTKQDPVKTTSWKDVSPVLQ